MCGILLSPIFANYGVAAAANCAQQREEFPLKWEICGLDLPVNEGTDYILLEVSTIRLLRL